MAECDKAFKNGTFRIGQSKIIFNACTPNKNARPEINACRFVYFWKLIARISFNNVIKAVNYDGFQRMMDSALEYIVDTELDDTKKDNKLIKNYVYLLT